MLVSFRASSLIRGLWFLGVCTALACSTTTEDGGGGAGQGGAAVRCGAGTVLAGDECLPVGPIAGSAGSAGAGGSALSCGPGTTLQGSVCVVAAGGAGHGGAAGSGQGGSSQAGSGAAGQGGQTGGAAGKGGAAGTGGAAGAGGAAGKGGPAGYSGGGEWGKGGFPGVGGGIGDGGGPGLGGMDPGGAGGMGAIVCDDPSCGHSLCEAGDKLPASCSPCAALLCAKDPYCCEQTYDAQCQMMAMDLCGCPCDPVMPPMGGQPTCTVPEPSPSAGSCVLIGDPVTCNPVTNAGCTNPGEACDLNTNGYTCFPGDNTVAVCGVCGQNNKFCAPGSTCINNTICARYCCDDGDCGAGFCDKTQVVAGVGVCMTPGAGGAGGDSGAGGDAGAGDAGAGDAGQGGAAGEAGASGAVGTGGASQGGEGGQSQGGAGTGGKAGAGG